MISNSNDQRNLVPKCLAITDGSNPNYFHMSPAHFCQNSNNMSKILICDLGAQTKIEQEKKGHKPTNGDVSFEIYLVQKV